MLISNQLIKIAKMLIKILFTIEMEKSRSFYFFYCLAKVLAKFFIYVTFSPALQQILNQRKILPKSKIKFVMVIDYATE
jgi:hypothetical protein